MNWYSPQTEWGIFKRNFASDGLRTALSVAWFNFRFELDYLIGGFSSAKAGKHGR